MAKKRLKIKDKQGNVVDYDISAASVTIDVEGKSLDVKLSELVDAIARSVKSVTFNGNSPTMDSNGNVNLGQQVQPDWKEGNINWPSYIKNKPSFSRVATTGSYNDLTDKPTIPEGVATDSQMSDSSDAPVKNRVIKAYVDNLISGLINGAPQALDTLNELSAALGNDANFAATITQQLANVYPKSQTYDKDEVDAKVADAGKVKSVTINGTKKTPNETTGDVDLGTIVGPQGPKGDQGDTLLVDGNFNPVTDIVNDTTTGGANKAWSAEMGKQLSEEVGSIPIIAVSVVGNEIVINTNAALAPTVIIGALNKSALRCRAGNTDTATFNVSGRRLTGNIVIEVAGDTTHFSVSPDSLAPSSGGVAATQITVTYTPGSGATAGDTHNCTVKITSGGVTYGTLQLTGTVAAAPSIQLTPASLTISVVSGQQGTATINVKGNALDGDISLAISGSAFTLSDNTVSKADAESAGGKNITVTFDGSADGARGTITASSAGATSVEASVEGDVAEPADAGTEFTIGGLTYTVLSENTKVSVKATSPSTLTGAIVVPSSVEDDGVNYEVSSIPADGFKGALITSITLPNTLKDIGGSAFYGASFLTSVDFGNGLESISGNTAFFGTKLVNVVLPDSLKTCGSTPFQNVTTLKSVQLGKTTAFSPTSIGNILTWAGSSTDDANDNSLDLVVCYAITPPTLSNYPRGIAGALLRVPSGSVSAYQAANNWNKFGTTEAI